MARSNSENSIPLSPLSPNSPSSQPEEIQPTTPTAKKRKLGKNNKKEGPKNDKHKYVKKADKSVEERIKRNLSNFTTLKAECKKKIITDFNKCWGNKNVSNTIKRENIADQMENFQRKINVYFDTAIGLVRRYEGMSVEENLLLAYGREYPRSVGRSYGVSLGGLKQGKCVFVAFLAIDHMITREC